MQSPSNHNKGLSISIGSLIFVLLFLSSFNFVFRTLDDIESSLIDVSVIHRLIGFFVIALYVFYKSPKIFHSIRGNQILFWFSMYCGYRILTTFWSVLPIWSFYRSLEFTFVFLFLVSLLDAANRSASLRRIANLLLLLYSGLFFTVVLGFFHSPAESFVLSDGLLPKIQGVFPRWNSNGMGHIAAIMIGILFVKYLWRRRLSVLLAIFGVMPFLVLSQTRSALFPIIMFLLGFYFFRVNALRKLVMVLSVILLGFVGSFSSLSEGISSYLVRGQTSEQLVTLSSRLLVWEATLENATSGVIPFTFGMGSFAGGRVVAEKNYQSTNEGAPITTLDNTWLELWIDEGIVGVLFVVLLLRLISREIIHHKKTYLGGVALCILVVTLFRSFFVSSTLLHTNFFFLLMVVIASQLRQQWCDSNLMSSNVEVHQAEQT